MLENIGQKRKYIKYKTKNKEVQDANVLQTIHTELS